MDINLEKLAPIVLFVYNRPEHARKTLDALAANALAGESELHIFCDGAKEGKPADGNLAVRKLIKEEQMRQRFSAVHLHISEKNLGLANSIIGGVSSVMKEYGRCIVIEDDVVTAPYFLTYMNGCLQFYQNSSQIFSISGFTYPLEALKSYPHDVYLSYRACSMSWASWEDRWNTIDWEVKDYDRLKHSPAAIRRFNRGGNDMFRMLRHQMRGERDSWAIRYCYSQSKQERYTIYPAETLVMNTGNDGSGTHCSALDDRTSQIKLSEKIDLQLEQIQFDRRVVRDFKKQYRVSFSEAVNWVYRKVFKK